MNQWLAAWTRSRTVPLARQRRFAVTEERERHAQHLGLFRPLPIQLLDGRGSGGPWAEWRGGCG